MANLSGPHLIIIVVVVLLLFGAPKLPALARSLGQSMRILKKEVGGGAETTDPDAANQDPATPDHPTAQPK